MWVLSQFNLKRLKLNGINDYIIGSKIWKCTIYEVLINYLALRKIEITKS